VDSPEPCDLLDIDPGVLLDELHPRLGIHACHASIVTEIDYDSENNLEESEKRRSPANRVPVGLRDEKHDDHPQER